MKKNLKKKLENLKKIGLTAIASFVACLATSVYVAPAVVSAQEAAPEATAVGIGVTLKETQETYEISVFENENNELVAACEEAEGFSYESTDGGRGVRCSYVARDGRTLYELRYSESETEEGEDKESVITVTQGADAVDVEISLNSVILDYDVYLDGEEKAEVSATLSNDGKTLTVTSEENETVAASDVMTVKILLPDNFLVEDFENTLELANDVLIPKIYMVVAIILLVALVIVGSAMFFVAG